MTRDTKDWNYDRIHTAMSNINDAQNDMMRCLHKGEVDDVVRDRMVKMLYIASELIKRLKLCHE